VITLNAPQKLPEMRTIRVFGTLTFSGNYVTGGEVPTGLVRPGTSKPPIAVSFTNKGDHTFKFDIATGKILVYAPGGAQLAAAAYPAAVTNDVVTMDAEYPKFG
jgi:hypothetical protein